MAAITSSAPPHLSSVASASEARSILDERLARSEPAIESLINMNPQTSPLRAHPEPILNDAQMSGGSMYFTSRRPQHQSLSQEDQSLASSLSHDINGHMSTLSPPITNGQAQTFGMGGHSGLSQTPSHPPGGPSTAGQHSGTDPNQDLSYGMGTDRRKRSKVSRACDECRRKKVRCDSNSSDGNVIETCSNCRRTKMTCQFERAPMKRGPSKGYIKELAERVQQVESHMGIPTGFRPSVDAGSPSDPYPDQSYSPTESMSGSKKRTFSQIDGRNPFAQSPRSSRDKMASLSGYSLSEGLHGGHGSFAIAPDQQLSDISPKTSSLSIDLTKPFWAQDTEVEHPRAKKTQDTKAPAGELWQAAPLFTDYLDLIHDHVSVLPRSFATVQLHVSNCSQELAGAFTYVLAVACGSRPPNDVYVSDSEVEDYAWMNARILPPNRNFSENIVWLWLYTFMIINSSADIARLRGFEKQLSQQTMLKMAVDLGQYLLASTKQEDLDQTDESLASTQNIVRRTWICINTLAQLHAIGTGTENVISSRDSESFASAADCRMLLSEPASTLAALSSILSLLASHTSASSFPRPDLMTTTKTRNVMESCVDIVLSTFPPTSKSSLLVREAKLFISLLLARHTFVNDPSEILYLALRLVELLSIDHVKTVVRPLEPHLYTLTGFTILELSDSEDVDLARPSQDALANLRLALEQVSERAHARIPNRLGVGQPEVTHPLHWADALLQVINVKGEVSPDQRLSESAIEEADTGEFRKDQKESSTDGSTRSKDNIRVISAQQKYLISRLTNVGANRNTIAMAGTRMTVVDFSLLTRKGYLNVLAELNGF